MIYAYAKHLTYSQEATLFGAFPIVEKILINNFILSSSQFHPLLCP